jgi:hypothetical protein
MAEFKIRRVPRPWNKGKLAGQKTPLKLKEIWAIRARLQVFRRTRELGSGLIDQSQKATVAAMQIAEK